MSKFMDAHRRVMAHRAPSEKAKYEIFFNMVWKTHAVTFGLEHLLTMIVEAYIKRATAVIPWMIGMKASRKDIAALKAEFRPYFLSWVIENNIEA